MYHAEATSAGLSWRRDAYSAARLAISAARMSALLCTISRRKLFTIATGRARRAVPERDTW